MSEDATREGSSPARAARQLISRIRQVPRRKFPALLLGFAPSPDPQGGTVHSAKVALPVSTLSGRSYRFVPKFAIFIPFSDPLALDNHYITQNGHGFDAVPFKPMLMAGPFVYPKPRTSGPETDVSDELTGIPR